MRVTTAIAILLLVSTGGLSQTTPPTTGLIGHWRLDDGSGTAAVDSSGNGRNGTLVGQPAWTTSGKINGALTFTGTNYVDLGNIAGGWSAITVSAWLKASAADASHLRIVYKSNAIDLRRNSMERFSFQVFNASSSATADSDVTFPDTEWHHVVGVFNGSQVDIYVDGVDREADSRPLTGPIRNSSSLLGISASYAGVNGAIDQVRIYNRALTAQEISSLYYETSSAPPPAGDTTPPSTPLSLSVSATSSTQVSLSWAASTDPVVAGQTSTGLAGYIVYRNGAQLASTTGTSYSDTSVAASTAYTYRVCAHDVAGNVSPQSTAAQATTPGPPVGPPTGSLVVHYTFDDGTATDISGNGNHGTISGAVPAAGRFNGGLSFDGVNDIVNVRGLADGQTALTVSAWFKASIADSGHLGIVFEDKSIDLRRNSTERFSFQVFNGSSSVTADSDVIYADTEWHHVVGVFTGTTVDIYVDGADAEATARNLTGPIRTDSGVLSISRSAAVMNGTLDDIRIYSRALTAAEIAELFAAGGGTTPPPPTSGSLTISLSGTGSGTVNGNGIACGADCSETYPAGTSVTLAAAASTGSSFSGWSGACSGTGSCTLTVTSAHTVAASFSTTQPPPPPPPPPASGSLVVADHNAVSNFSLLPDYWIEQVKSRRMIWAHLGASHARQLHYGFQLLEAQDTRFGADVAYNPASFANINNIRDLTGRYTAQYRSWTDTGGAEHYWLNDAARNTLSATIQQVPIAIGIPVSVSTYGWSYHMCSPSYSSNAIGHAITDADVQAYISTVSSFNNNTALDPAEFVYTTSGLDSCNTTSDTAYNTGRWNQMIRQAAATNGGYVFDQGDIEAWNNTNTAQRSLTDYAGRSVTLRHTDYNEGGAGDTYSGDHTNDALELRKAKAAWWLMARIAGWDGVASSPYVTSTAFAANDRVKATLNLNVRTSASINGALAGTQLKDAVGTVVGGPVYADGYYWWNVNFDQGVDGWVVQGYIVRQ